ncbi:peptidoglycan bridge formation glycyltransferase FemA/FemB family protein [Aureibaculum conchae]|uniref:peptidoglycan bridge formation glycyltransferase FemA/FemB family protein n=1 Tax=Aureibaculum sp. 2308TA14-22 TaxID=3108392 RepID=UPI00339AC80B
MKLLINEGVRRDKWTNLLENSQYSNPFHTESFYNFYNSIEEFSADVFALEENDQYTALVVVTIQKELGVKGYFSRRGIIYAGPVFTNNSESTSTALLKGVFNYYRKKLIYIESRNNFDYSAFKNHFGKLGFNYVPWLNFHLNTKELASMKKVMSSSKLRQIKKSIKNGAHWAEAKSEKEIKYFYAILSDLYKNKVKKPLFPEEFFIEFFRKNVGKCLLVYKGNTVIGGIICPILKNKIIYEMYVCGLDQEYKHLYPSSMATWAAMEYAVQNNIALFDFMGAGSPDEDYGVREFKSRFGGEQVEHGRFMKIINPFLFKIGSIGVKVLAKIK